MNIIRPLPSLADVWHELTTTAHDAAAAVLERGSIAAGTVLALALVVLALTAAGAAHDLGTPDDAPILTENERG